MKLLNLLRNNIGTKLRFGTVGAANTAIDFGLLFILRSLGLPVISANIISTTVAFCFSFFANKKYTFRSTGGNVKRELLMFVVVTLFGLWILQTAVIQLVLWPLHTTALPHETSLLIAKVIATLVSLVWNYVMYSRVVFKNSYRL
jgi:putative flippase GtrA